MQGVLYCIQQHKIKHIKHLILYRVMAHNSTYQSKTISRWGIVWLVVLFACMPICANAYYVGDYYSEDEYYDEYYYEEGYCSYESNVQDAFSSAAPGSENPSNISGRHNAIGTPSDPLDEQSEFPIGEPWVMLALALGMAGYTFIRQQRRSTVVALLLLVGASGTYTVAATPTTGDYRLLYIEQVAKKITDGIPEVQRTHEYASDIIKATDSRTLYSLHIFNKIDPAKTDVYGNVMQGLNNPEIILQRYNGTKWEDVMRHMVLGMVHTDFNIAGMPGRRNVVIVDDDGIENIKNDLKNIQAYDPEDPTTHFYIGKDNPTAEDYQTYIDNFKNDECSGVWNFVVNRNPDNTINSTTPLLIEKTHRYQGEYYIRSEATGSWNTYQGETNQFTRWNPSQDHSNYSHYFCKDIAANTVVKFTIANDYSEMITTVLVADEIVTDAAAKLPLAASVRFSWNEKTNLLHRAYIDANATGDFLTLVDEGDYKVNFQDNTNANWIYHVDVSMNTQEKLRFTADYNGKKQDFIGKSTDNTSGIRVLLGDPTSEYHPVRLIYDFKTNEIMSAYVPRDNTDATDIEPIQTNLMLIRTEEANNADSKVTQLVFNTNSMQEVGQYAYGVLELTKDRLNNSALSAEERSFYWISFPFDVNLNNVFGYGEYGKHWVIESYDGASRAAKGLWKDEGMNTYWTYHWDKNMILKAGQGYVVALDLELIQSELSSSPAKAISLYFQSNERIKKDIIQYTTTFTTNVPEHECTIYRNTPYGDRRILDSHWNIIGVPSYANAGVDFADKTVTTMDGIKYYYQWNGKENKYIATEGISNPQPLNAYMVQYYGDLNWTSIVNETPSPIAARKNTDSETVHNLRLELQQNGNQLDRAFVTLQEDDVTAGFDFNYDLCKITNKGANIYSLIATENEPIEVAGNVLPLDNNTIIPVGVKITAAGEYTFAMPDGTDGIVVELIDYQANTTTNLLFNDYTVNLPKGTFDNRFALSVKPDKTATSLENIFNDATGDEVKKYIIDGILYMQKDGVLYDAQGHIVR